MMVSLGKYQRFQYAHESCTEMHYAKLDRGVQIKNKAIGPLRTIQLLNTDSIESIFGPCVGVFEMESVACSAHVADDLPHRILE